MEFCRGVASAYIVATTKCFEPTALLKTNFVEVWEFCRGVASAYIVATDFNPLKIGSAHI